MPETGDGLDFYLAQARLRALFDDQPEQAIAWFRDELEQTSSPAQLRAHQYGLAVALQRERQFDEAIDRLNALEGAAGTRDPRETEALGRDKARLVGAIRGASVRLDALRLVVKGDLQ